MASQKAFQLPLTQGAEPLETYGLYALGTTQKFDYGTRLLTNDGRVFKYFKSGGECRTGRGAFFGNAIPAVGIDYSLLAADAAIGDALVKMTNQGVVAQTLDGLRGGKIVLKISTADTNVDATLQQRLILGNTAGGLSDVITINLDAPLIAALTAAASYGFCMPSPYNNLAYGSATKRGVAGVPARYLSASGYFSWAQTWGSIWIAPQDAVGKTDFKRGFVFRHDGSINLVSTGGSANNTDQYGGFVVDNNEADNGATELMLQISI